MITKPFGFEGAQRTRIAEEGWVKLRDRVDALITIPNDRVLQLIEKKTSLLDAFQIVDDVLRQGVQGMSEVITTPGLINVDFADVRSIMRDTGSALMGIGRASGENRAVEAAKAAIASPLLDLSIDGAKGILFTITGSSSLGMHEVAEAAKVITGNADPGAKVIFGSVIDDNLKDELRITVIATGFDHRESAVPSYNKNSFRENSSYTAPSPSLRSSLFSAGSIFRKDKEEKKEDKPSVSAGAQFQKKSLKKEETEEEELSADEELEIPAFIRKKMM